LTIHLISFSSSLYFHSELENVRYIIDYESYPEYEVKSLNGDTIKQGDRVEYLMFGVGWMKGVVRKIITTDLTTAEVVTQIVIPATASDGCCYADKFPGGPKPPSTLMSHWWGNSFIHLVKVMIMINNQ